MASFFLAAKTSEYGEYRINDFVGGKERSGKNLKIKNVRILVLTKRACL